MVEASLSPRPCPSPAHGEFCRLSRTSERGGPAWAMVIETPAAASSFAARSGWRLVGRRRTSGVVLAADRRYNPRVGRWRRLKFQGRNVIEPNLDRVWRVPRQFCETDLVFDCPLPDLMRSTTAASTWMKHRPRSRCIGNSGRACCRGCAQAPRSDRRLATKPPLARGRGYRPDGPTLAVR